MYDNISDADPLPLHLISKQPAFRRHTAFEEESDEEEGSIDPSSATAADDIDPEVEAFLASQRKALRPDDDDIDARMREERIRTGGLKTTKSRYQREREEAERKKAVQEEEAARAYKDFVEAMEGGAPRAGQSGSSRSMGPAGSSASKSKPIGFVSAGGKIDGRNVTTRSFAEPITFAMARW